MKRGSDLSKVYGDSNYVLITSDQSSPWKIGETILVGNETLEIAGLLKYDPFSDDGLTHGRITIITSSETFVRLTGITDYSLVMIQTASEVTDENSVSARMKQYGAMRAVGMDERQITKMIAAEAVTYSFWGCVVGCIVGLPLSKLLYDFLIAEHFPGAVWNFPVSSLIVILLFVVLAATVAAYAPAKRIRNISVTETINEL